MSSLLSNSDLPSSIVKLFKSNLYDWRLVLILKKIKNMESQQTTERRRFLKTTGILGAGLLLPNLSHSSSTLSTVNGNIHQFGKREGYTDQVSILVSMMDWMRMIITRDAKDLSQKEVDYLLDDNSNSIGAMLIHLAATGRYYQKDTFWVFLKASSTLVWKSRFGMLLAI